MRSVRPIRLSQAGLISLFSLFALGFNHSAMLQNSMAGMEGMDHSGLSGVQCQILCTTAIKTDDTIGVAENIDDKDPLPSTSFEVTILLSLIAVGFVVKYLHLSSSWRPPDKVLLYGRYAASL